MDSVSTLQDITSYWRFYCKSWVFFDWNLHSVDVA
jgi:hypothetical protein